LGFAEYEIPHAEPNMDTAPVWNPPFQYGK
jgi:hypothetical protein